MSKAFTKEDASSGADVAQPPVRLAPGEKRYVTPGGYARLKRELEGLPSSSSRAPQLAALLGVLTVVEVPAEAPDQVVFGAWVDLVEEEGRSLSYRLVGPDEADVSAGLLSIDSPVARALVGKRAEDEVEVQTPRGTRSYTVAGVRGGAAQ